LNEQADLPYVSVVILNYNGAKFAEGCLRSVLAADYSNIEVIVVDNASTDGSYELLRDLFSDMSKVTLIRNQWNLGYAEGNNVGFRHSRGDIIAFLNIDTEVTRSWLKELVKALGPENVGAAQSKLIKLQDRRSIDSVGWGFDQLGYGFSRSVSGESMNLHQADELFYAEGVAMAIKREVLNEVLIDGVPFDSEYFIYYEDTDLSWRIRLRGYTIMFAPISIVYHHRSFVLRELPYHFTYYFTRNRISMLIKNYSLSNLVRWIPLLLFLEFTRAIILLRYNPLTAHAKLRGIVWNIKNLRRLWRKRNVVQCIIRKVPDTEIARLMRAPNFAALCKSTRP